MNFSDSYREIFGEEYVRDKYKLKPHKFDKKAAGKPYCSCCGLVAFNNDFTRWSIKMGCFSDLHPQYESKRKQLTKL